MKRKTVEAPIIIRDEEGRCVHCGRRICKVIHEEDDLIRAERQRRENEALLKNFFTK